MEDNTYEIGFDIFITGRAIRRYVDSGVANELNSGQGRLISFIRRRMERGENTFQRDVEAEFNIRRSSVTSVLQLLEKKGLITRESVPEDARLKRIVLTKRGIEVNDMENENIRSSEKKLMEALTRKELSDLQKILKKLREAIPEGEGGEKEC